MWTWILIGGVLLFGLTLVWLRRGVSEDPTSELEVFVDLLIAEIHEHGPDYSVRGMVPGTFTMVINVKGQEVPVPLDNIHRHYVTFPDQLALITQQLLEEIEEVALETPRDHMFVDAAMRIMPQIRARSWLFQNGPAFGDAALVHREIGPDLAICYVIDDPWSMVFVCQAHLDFWGRTEEDIFHLANQNLRRMSGAGLPMPGEGPVRVGEGDGYDAARVLLLDPDASADLLIGMPGGDALFLGRRGDRATLESLMAMEEEGDGEIYRLEDQQLVPVENDEA